MVDCTWCDGTGKVKIQGAGKRPAATARLNRIAYRRNTTPEENQ